MPIRKYIDEDITPEVARAMREAFALACRALKERGLDNNSTQAIAAKISALAHAGECDPKRLADLAVGEVRMKMKKK